jgi:hypothetical protein
MKLSVSESQSVSPSKSIHSVIHQSLYFNDDADSDPEIDERTHPSASPSIHATQPQTPSVMIIYVPLGWSVVKSEESGKPFSRTVYPLPPSLVNMATMRSSNIFLDSFSLDSIAPQASSTSCTAAHSRADPRAISKNRRRSASVTFPFPSAIFNGMDSDARSHCSLAAFRSPLSLLHSK